MINLSIQNIIPFFVQHLLSSSLSNLKKKKKREIVTGQDPSGRPQDRIFSYILISSTLAPLWST